VEEIALRSLENKTAIVVGASRGLGRGIADAFLAAGATVVAVARDTHPLSELAAAEPRLQVVAADAADPIVAGTLLAQWRPDVVALVAGAKPLLRPIHLQTWETVSVNWLVDVRMTFHWLREALLLPLGANSRVIVMSSGAALMGSPLSGGYAGAKATQRFMAEYASQESKRLGLGIGITAVLPRLTPATELGRPAVTAYSAREGVSEAEYIKRMGAHVTPAIAGQAFIDLAGGPMGEGGAYVLTGEGLKAIPDSAPPRQREEVVT
jgi:NAD(P)-dependent dehydrogenase (short-subunit alcohol dehydrogenase family)